MDRAIVVAFHKYTPYGDRFYEPILEFFLRQMRQYQSEFDMLYLLDSTWDIGGIKESWGINKMAILKVDPSLRYYDVYKAVLPEIKEDAVLFMDNDMVVYREGIIGKTFSLLSPMQTDVVSIYDTIGEHSFSQLGNKSKFCPYWFATYKELLMKYRGVEWGPNMPVHETLGALTEAMLADGVRPQEWEEDKSNCLFDGAQDGERGKDLGYYHIRSGSTVAYLLATRLHGDSKTYWDYLNNQPRSELLRHCAWYEYMLTEISPSLLLMLRDMKVTEEQFYEYFHRFKKYHNLP